MNAKSIGGKACWTLFVMLAMVVMLAVVCERPQRYSFYILNFIYSYSEFHICIYLYIHICLLWSVRGCSDIHIVMEEEAIDNYPREL